MTDGETRGDETEVRTVALAIVAGVFFGGVGTGVAFPTLPLLDRYLGITATVLGVVLAANRIARLVTNAPAGQVVDRLGARRPMIAGLLVQGLAPFGYVVGLHAPRETFAVLPLLGPVSTPAVVFVLARCLWGVGSAFVFIGAFSTITRVTDASNRGKWTGYMRGGQSLGFPTGLVLGGLLADLFSVQTAFLVAGVLALGAGVVAALVIPDVEPSRTGGTRLRELPRLVRREPRVLPIGFANATLRFLFAGVMLTTVVKYAAAANVGVAGLDAAGASGLVMGGGIVASSAATLGGGRLSDRLDNRVLVALPALSMVALGFAVLAFVPSLSGLLGGTLLIGAGNGGTVPTLLAYLGDVSPGDDVGKLGGVYNVFGDVGLSLGPLVAVPAVASAAGFAGTYLACAALAAACLLVVNATLVRA